MPFWMVFPLIGFPDCSLNYFTAGTLEVAAYLPIWGEAQDHTDHVTFSTIPLQQSSWVLQLTRCLSLIPPCWDLASIIKFGCLFIVSKPMIQ